jgi:hypothetical protein
MEASLTLPFYAKRPRSKLNAAMASNASSVRHYPDQYDGGEID